jgi:hypothetical protein
VEVAAAHLKSVVEEVLEVYIILLHIHLFREHIPLQWEEYLQDLDLIVLDQMEILLHLV